TEAGRFSPLEHVFDQPQPDVFVVVNRWKVALKLRKLFPDVPIFLWLHVFPGRHNRRMGAALKKAGITLVCVSRSHANAVQAFCGPDCRPNITAIYNPIADDLRPDPTPRDTGRLLFASSPHKGLKQVFEQFAALRKTLPDMTLAVADPGYLRWETGPAPEGVVFLGSLPHSALLHQMRRSLCLFYPQTSFAETFGLVLAEANATGTPALIHAGLGANDEIVSGAEQLIDGNDAAQILARITEWRARLPRVSANAQFRLSSVQRAWVRTLTKAVSPVPRLQTARAP
ncbi:MAG: glycosyltransferase, partial [Sulfitobacter sp.]|nr:glycosyltransferase [Sulfitobacter sp.]